MNSKVIIATGIALLLFGCGAKDEQAGTAQPPAAQTSTPAASYASEPVYDASATPEEAFRMTHEAAIKLQAKAREIEHEWSRSADMLDAASELAAEGNFKAALELAETARQQYGLAIQQAAGEADQWQSRALD